MLFPLPHPDLFGTRPRMLSLILLGLAYYGGAQAAFLIGTLSDRIFAPFWPPNIILFCALLTTPSRHWWMLIAAAFPAHVAAEIGVGMRPTQYLIAFATNCSVALLSAFAMRRFMIGSGWLETLRQAGTYVLITVVASPAICALGGAFVPLLSGGEIMNYWVSWAHWYSANALASATLGAVLLTFIVEPPTSRPQASQIGEALLLAITLVGVCAIAFGAAPRTVPGGFLPTLLYLPLPLVVWAAIRFGVRGASVAVLVVTLVSISCNLKGSTVFDSSSTEYSSLALQVFLLAFSVPVLLLGATIEQQRATENTLQEFARGLLRGQDDERRNVARTLHDSMGQNLVGAGLIARGMAGHVEAPIDGLLAEISGILRWAVRELHSMSRLLHPPLLDDMGLAPALRCYATSFSARNAIAVDFDLPDAMQRLDANVELALFRVVQEALNNVSHHSGSPRACIRARIDGAGAAREFVLVVEDFGRGFLVGTRVALTGAQLESLRLAKTGLRGMHERLRQIGGQLRIDSSFGRTMVVATVPAASAL